MNTPKGIRHNILYAVALLVAIIVLFTWFTVSNSNRIEEQNLNYAMDSANQTAEEIGNEFTNAQRRIRVYAYFMSVALSSPDASVASEMDAEMLQELESNTDFDSIRFVTAKGQNLTSEGGSSDVSDREYFINGMRGESGCSMVLASRVNGETTMVFYAPVRDNGKVVGVLTGLYLAEDYLKEILRTTYFGEYAEVYLCNRDGSVIASSQGESQEEALPATMLSANTIDDATAAGLWKVFSGETESEGFICDAQSLTDNVCAMRVPGTDYILVQAFPQSVTQQMIDEANQTGIILQVILVVLFASYILFLLVRNRRERRKLEKQNEQQDYVIKGLNTLFSSRYLTVDLDTGRYSYTAGVRPAGIDLDMEGDYERFLQVHASDIIEDSGKRDFYEFFKPESLREHLAESDTVSYECHVERDGKELWELLMAVCLERDADGKANKILFVRQDNTRLKEHELEQERALHDALMQAQHANNAKSTFLTNMSHDIRTPMNAIIGFATLAVSRIDNKDQVLNYLQKVLTAGNHLTNLINDILDMSRIESGKIQIVEQDCNISELTHNLLNMIQPQIQAKQLELFVDTFEVENEDVVADPLKLSQIFINLLNNAVKYTPAGGSVSFRIQQKTTRRKGFGDYVFVVKDNGVGMTQDFVDHIFEPFEREASVTKTGIEGTGLGMAITKSIVEMMGGSITVKSEKGKGSEFRVELNLKLQDVEDREARIKELEGLRALVVDDDCDSCESVSKMLEDVGMRSEWTVSGKEAVHRARSAHDEGDPFRTYIVDWQMPEMNGLETVRRIRSVIGDDAPIIILTAYDWSEIEEEAREAGVTAFCSKPLFMSDLKSVLLAANDLVKHEEEAKSWTEADFHGKRILLVDDNMLNREIAKEILEETGFVVETAPDGTDAVEMIVESPDSYYDAVLMDVQMPIMNGYEATEAIRGLPRDDVKTLPILAMTADAMEEDRIKALESGMNAHLTKPLDIELFLSTLAQFLE